MMCSLVNMRIFVWCGRCWTETNHYQSLVLILQTKSRRCSTWNCSNGQGVLLHILVTPNQSSSYSCVPSCVWVCFSSKKKPLCFFVWCGFFCCFNHDSRIKRIGFHVEYGLFSPMNHFNHFVDSKVNHQFSPWGCKN
jgi:hypothetical protein